MQVCTTSHSVSQCWWWIVCTWLTLVSLQDLCFGSSFHARSKRSTYNYRMNPIRFTNVRATSKPESLQFVNTYCVPLYLHLPCVCTWQLLWCQSSLLYCAFTSMSAIPAGEWWYCSALRSQFCWGTWVWENRELLCNDSHLHGANGLPRPGHLWSVLGALHNGPCKGYSCVPSHAGKSQDGVTAALSRSTSLQNSDCLDISTWHTCSVCTLQ